MKLFQCQVCGQVLHFENGACLGCGHALGYLPDEARMLALSPEGAQWRAAGGDAAKAGDPQWRFCRNWERSACNWLVPASDGAEAPFCTACQHNRTVPDLSAPVNLARWQAVEQAKRRLIYTLDRMGLPRPAPGSGHPQPLVFDFLADDPGLQGRILTGHAAGVVTIALIEADDAARESMRARLGERYRTLLGHFRHEVGHYYWDILVRDGGQIAAFRALFGDERADYAAALERHYQTGAPPGWDTAFVSPYATMHPWEDWAETWAHYLHMTDTLETAAALGIAIDPPTVGEGDLSAEIDFDPYRARDVDALLAAWTPLSVALNALARSMGQPDIYPFALSVPVHDKLAFVHGLVRGARIAPGVGSVPGPGA
jgi:hypothetical protein